MRKALPLICLLSVFALPAHATEWGVLPLPKNALSMRPEDYAEAVDLAMGIKAPINVSLLSWKDLEPKAGVYDVKNRLGGMAYSFTKGMSGYFGISLINTLKRDMPDDLIDMEWSDPALLPRFEKLLDQVASQLPPQHVPYFVIGNEVDVYFEKHPDEVQAYLGFYRAARAMVKQRFPNTKVGITVTYEGLKKGRESLVATMVSESDAAFFTFYPFLDLKVLPPATIPPMLDEVIAAAQGKDILLQEIGYPSSPLIGSSPALQAEFFTVILPAIKARPQIKVASVFLMHDLEPKLCDMLTGYYGADQWGDKTAPFKAFLCTLGVRGFEGTPKPAWDVIAKLLGTP